MSETTQEQTPERELPAEVATEPKEKFYFIAAEGMKDLAHITAMGPITSLDNIEKVMHRLPPGRYIVYESTETGETLTISPPSVTRG